MPKLWPFQRDDIEYLESQRSALVVWDPGLGKTFGALERDRIIRQKYPDARTLIVAPLATHEQWVDWLNLVFTSPAVTVFSHDRDKALYELKNNRSQFHILHWELLRNVNQKMWATRELYPAIIKAKFHHIIADEVHRAKERKTQNAKVLKVIGRNSKDPMGFNGYRTGLTGTPITNKPPDLWSLLNWVRPKEYTAFWKFDERYAIRIEQWRGKTTYKEYVGPRNTEELQAKIAPFVVQRRKADVLTELPDRYYTEIKVDLAPKQRRAFDSMEKNMVAWVGEHENDPLAATAVVSKYMRLQQFAIAHADLLLTPHRHKKKCTKDCQIQFDENVKLSEPSSKLDAVLQLLEDSPEDKQFVIFSQFEGAISLLASRLSKSGISCVVFTGDVGPNDRRSALDQFTGQEARVFAATIGAGGEGIDGLQCASTVIFLDRSWSPAANDQAISRLHRAGQKNAVQVVHIKARNTVDQYKDRRLVQKARWVREVLG